MAGTPIVIKGVMTDDAGNSSNITILGVYGDPRLSIGGGPIMPPLYPSHPIVLPPGTPEHPWIPPTGGGGQPPMPGFPIWGPPGIEFPPIPGYPPTIGGGPIIPPPPVLPPDFTPPPPGSVITLPGNQPVQPIVSPPFIKVYYPGVGWIVVTNPNADVINPLGKH